KYSRNLPCTKETVTPTKAGLTLSLLIPTESAGASKLFVTSRVLHVLFCLVLFLFYNCLSWILDGILLSLTLQDIVNRFLQGVQAAGCLDCVQIFPPTMSSKMQSSNNIAQARRIVQQLRIEANIERIKVSKASADLMHYCGEHARYDPLLMGIPASENPFKDKKPCTIL
ncbi:hypothetical protein AMEX_G7838, partial [Astyanax mexicanus]